MLSINADAGQHAEKFFAVLVGDAPPPEVTDVRVACLLNQRASVADPPTTDRDSLAIAVHWFSFSIQVGLRW